jgi:hypothetical protein
MNKLTLQDAIKSSYKSKSRGETLLLSDGYIFDKKLSNIKDRVYYNPNNRNLLITYRGTTNLINDIPADLAILTGNFESSTRYHESKDKYNQAKLKYGVNSATLVGHSLGGTVANTIGGKNDKIYTYNKGAGLFDSFLTKPNEQAYRHRADIVSLTSAFDKNTHQFGNYLVNPIQAHDSSQIKSIKPIYI